MVICPNRLLAVSGNQAHTERIVTTVWTYVLTFRSGEGKALSVLCSCLTGFPPGSIISIHNENHSCEYSPVCGCPERYVDINPMAPGSYCSSRTYAITLHRLSRCECVYLMATGFYLWKSSFPTLHPLLLS